MVAGFTNEGTYTPDGLLAADRETVSRQITLVSGQNLKRGALLGKITSGGKYTLSLSASSDGSQTPAVILAEDCDASAGDKVTVAYFAATVDENAMIYGTGQTAANTREALRDVGIYLQSSLVR
jgi:hypothetical protein